MVAYQDEGGVVSSWSVGRTFCNVLKMLCREVNDDGMQRGIVMRARLGLDMAWTWSALVPSAYHGIVSSLEVTLEGHLSS